MRCEVGYCAGAAFPFINSRVSMGESEGSGSMSEKPESDEFDEEDSEEPAPGIDDVDVDHIMRDVESQRRRAPKGAEPAWRRLERVMEERRTAELLSDFDDYEIDSDDDNGAASDSADKPTRKKKKAR